MSNDGIILVDKKAGITSLATDNFIKKLMGTKKVGHSGTLDPFATGLLPVFVGNALKLMRYTDGYDKAYVCTAKFGQATDTMDKDGTVTEENLPSPENLAELKADGYREIRDAFEKISKIDSQIPPRYSAKKIAGRKAYELAREGVEVELKPHPVKIFSLVINDIKEDEGTFFVTFEVKCSKGTYIRTICDDVGRLTGFYAHAVSLRRTECGGFNIADAYTEERLAELMSAGDTSFLRDRSEAVSHLLKFDLTSDEASAVRQGKKIKAPSWAQEGTRYAAYEGDTLVAIIYPSTENDRKIMRIERVTDVIA